jgi:hypothetical protein
VADIPVVSDVLTDLGLIPPARLGPFVAMARQQIGMSREQLAAASQGRLTLRDVSLLERGRLVCREAQLSAIQELLGVPFGKVVPLRARLIIDPMQCRMVLGGHIAEVVPNASDSELLLRYLALVYLCRRARPGSFVVPRSDDLEVLSELLGHSTESIRQELAHLCHHERDVLRLAVRSASQRRSPRTELKLEIDTSVETEDASVTQIAPARFRKLLSPKPT